jgi:hypothetical protein
MPVVRYAQLTPVIPGLCAKAIFICFTGPVIRKIIIALIACTWLTPDPLLHPGSLRSSGEGVLNDTADFSLFRIESLACIKIPCAGSTRPKCNVTFENHSMYSHYTHDVACQNERSEIPSGKQVQYSTMPKPYNCSALQTLLDATAGPRRS